MTGYGALVRHAGAGRLLAALVLAWGSYGPLTLGLFLSVRAATGSAAAAGLAEAANAAGFAVLAAPRGRLIDRRGGMPWLVVITAVFAGCLLGIVACARAGVHAWWPYLVISGLVGLASPPLVAAVRSSWTNVVPQDRLRPAYAVTGVIGDVAFVVGPVLAAVLFALGRPLPLLACAVLVVAAGAVAAPDVPPAAARPDQTGVPAAMVPLLAASVALGMAMGTVDVATPTAVQAWGHSGWAGPLLALFATGSVAGGLWFGHRHWRAPALRRYLAVTAGVGAVLALGALTTTPVWLGLVLLVAGGGYGPATVCLFEALDDLMPRRGTEALGWVVLMEGAGTAAGAATAGWLGGTSHHTSAFAVAGGTLAAVTLVVRGWRPRGGAHPHRAT